MAIDTTTSVDVQTLTPFKKFIMTIGNLPTSYLESMTYAELVMWFCNYLQETVIPTVNNNAEAVEELQDLYEELRSYVNDYFDNLDVQEEINNKLDNMAQDGSLYNIIRQYTDPIVNQQNTRITSVENQVRSVASGSPLVATSTSGMTDTTRIYVNTTDGKWYYYNGSAWTIGGTYQSTGIGDNEIYYNMLESALQDGIVISKITTGDIASVGSFYSGGIGSTISLSSSNQLASGYMSVNPNDILIVPFIEVSTSYEGITPLILTDSNDVIKEKYSIAQVRPESGMFKIKIPNNVSKVYWNCKINNSANMRWYPYIVKGYNYLDTRVTNNLTNTVEIEQSDSLEGIYSCYYWNYALGNYFTRVYDVDPLDKINLQTTIATAAVLNAGVFVNADGKPIEWIPPRGNSSATTSVNVDLIVPASATKLYVTVNNSSVITKVYKYVYNDVSDITKKLTVSLSDGVLTMTNNSNGNYVQMAHGSNGNNLFEIRQYKVGDETKNITTDMTPAPYIVEAVNNGNGDRETRGFTGGNHQWNNQESGSTATAEEISLNIYCDGSELSSGSTAYCDEVTIVEINRVQGSNTCLEAGGGRNIIEERIVFKFDGKTLSVKNSIKPLEDIKLYTYYGIQLAGANTSNYKAYADKLYYSTNFWTCTRKPDQIFGGNIISSRMESAGLGAYLTEHSEYVNISNNKAYFVPVKNSNGIVFSQNDVQYIFGSYIFDENQI